MESSPKPSPNNGASLSIYTDPDKNQTLSGAELAEGFASQDLFLFLAQPSPPLVIDNVEDIVVIVNYTVGKPKA